jgi:uncharacterized membrane protein YbhN (UPF0104 family)
MFAGLKNKQRLKALASPLLIALFLGVFVYFFVTHPKLRHALAAANPWVLLLIAALYGVFILCLSWVYNATLQLCGKRLAFRENFLLTCYSTIVNFFGPLQSGPGVRAVYLKQKHGIRLRDYTVASLAYYAIYAIISALFLLSASGTYWVLGLAATLCVVVGSIGIVVFFKRRFSRSKDGLQLDISPKTIGWLSLATLCQLVLVAVIFYVELHAIHVNAGWRQALAYGGAANFALFVALTPGAIGFREAFLAFSQQLHHISTPNILAASVIDRAVYVAFLGLLFLIVLGLHADRRFRVARSAASDAGR